MKVFLDLALFSRAAGSYFWNCCRLHAHVCEFCRCLFVVPFVVFVILDFFSCSRHTSALFAIRLRCTVRCIRYFGFLACCLCSVCRFLIAPSATMSLVLPFWRSNAMERESVLFLPREDGPEIARLLFQPDTIVCLTDAAEQRVYADGRDYTLDVSRGGIVRSRQSAIPRAIRQHDELTHSHLCLVTYTHQDQWHGIVPAFAGDRLQRTIERLRTRQALTVCLTGDSISEGYDASGFHNLPPHQPPFGPIIADSLSKHYRSD